jgi:hypothetical protein
MEAAWKLNSPNVMEASLLGKNPDPVQSPEVPVHTRLRGIHVAGILFLGFLPLLAVLGITGNQDRVLFASSDKFNVSVSYTLRADYRQLRTMEIRIQNRSRERMPEVLVRLEKKWADFYTEVQFTPQAERSFVIRLPALQAGASHLVTGEMRAYKVGPHEGLLSVEGAGDRVRFNLKSWNIP